jgi:hypothetical protein
VILSWLGRWRIVIRRGKRLVCLPGMWSTRRNAGDVIRSIYSFGGLRGLFLLIGGVLELFNGADTNDIVFQQGDTGSA